MSRRDRIAEGIGHDLRAQGVPVVRAGWSRDRLAVELRTGGIMLLAVKPDASDAQLEAFRASAIAAFLEEWQRQRQALEDRLLGTCTECGVSLDDGLVYLRGGLAVCPACYAAHHTAQGDGSQGANP